MAQHHSLPPVLPSVFGLVATCNRYRPCDSDCICFLHKTSRSKYGKQRPAVAMDPSASCVSGQDHAEAAAMPAGEAMDCQDGGSQRNE